MRDLPALKRQLPVFIRRRLVTGNSRPEFVQARSNLAVTLNSQVVDALLCRIGTGRERSKIGEQTLHQTRCSLVGWKSFPLYVFTEETTCSMTSCSLPKLSFTLSPRLK